MFNRSEKKKKVSYFALGIGALATVGVCSILRSTRSFWQDKMGRLKSSLKRNKCGEECEQSYTEGESSEEDSVG